MRFFGIFFLVIFSIFGYEFGVSALKLTAERKTEGIWVYFTVNSGYGVQKDGKNSLALYELKKGHEKETNIEKKLKDYGTEIKKISSFEGSIAKEDPLYYSTLNPVFFKGNYTKHYILKGKFFVCSFAQKFCTVQSIIISVP